RQVAEAKLAIESELGAEERERGGAIRRERDARGAQWRGGEDRLEVSVGGRGGDAQRALALERRIEMQPEACEIERVEADAAGVHAVGIGVVGPELLRGDRVHEDRAFLDVAGVAEVALTEEANTPLRRLPGERAAALPQLVVDAVATACLDAE